MRLKVSVALLVFASVLCRATSNYSDNILISDGVSIDYTRLNTQEFPSIVLTEQKAEEVLAMPGSVIVKYAPEPESGTSSTPMVTWIELFHER
jgi:hypothetical protein